MSAPTPQLELTTEFKQALDLLDSGSHLFLTGKAGTGKSTLVRHYLANTDRKVIVTAPTGIAALNVDGYTVHRLFSFRPDTTLSEVRTGDYYPGRFAKAIKAMESLIVDEASMLRADMFDMVEAALRRFGPQPTRPFGGVQLVLVGDLAQLPPVVTTAEEEYFTTHYDSPFFFSAHQFDRQTFPTIALTKVFRQIGDQRLTSVLNAVREGVLSTETSQTLDARVDPDFEPPEHQFWLTLAATNRIATARNNRKLETLDGPEHHFTAITNGDTSMFDNSIVEQQLRYKVGAQVMMLTNDSANQWVNGTLGKITHVDDDGSDPRVQITFRDGRRAMVDPHVWEITQPTTVDGALHHDVVGSVTQLPFKLAWAITIHKSQGQTVDHLLVDLSGGAFASGQTYVALSRCTGLDGLVLKRAIHPKDLKLDRRVLRFMAGATNPPDPNRICAIAALTVGNVGSLYRPRPVEIAVAFNDGTALSTLINPGCDLFDARERLGIEVSDIRLAPTLSEAWSLIGRAVVGWTPIGVDIDTCLQNVDFELKRGGTSTALPVGVELAEVDLTRAEARQMTAASALTRAHTMLAAHARSGHGIDGGTTFGEYLPDDVEASFLLTRDPQAPTPAPATMPMLGAIAQVSRELSAVVLDGKTAEHVMTPGDDLATVRELIGRGLSQRLAPNLPLPTTMEPCLPQLDRLLGTHLTRDSEAARDDRLGIADVLVPGTTFCISGSPMSAGGLPIEKGEVARIAADRELIYVESLTKRRCQVLLVAEEGSQSGKAKKAKEWGKPVFSLTDFWSWLEG